MKIEIKLLEQVSGLGASVSSIAVPCKVVISNFNTIDLDAEIRVRVADESTEETKIKFDVFGYQDSPSGAMIAELEGSIENNPSILPTDELWIDLKVGKFESAEKAVEFAESVVGREALDAAVKHIRVSSGHDGDHYEFSVHG